jgi:hypothetical protein
MQTFLPYKSFKKSVKALDYKRLGKQRVEAMQLLNALDYRKTYIPNTGARPGWINHPATLMWVGYELALVYYQDLCIKEWIRRGYNNNMIIYGVKKKEVEFPPWVGNPEFHLSHKANLLRKDFEFYSKEFGTNINPDLPYVWPVSDRI